MNSDPRHRARHHQLWIDKVRGELDARNTPQEFERTLKGQALIRLLGGHGSLEEILALPRGRLATEFMKYDLADPLPVVAMRALKARGYPHHELTRADCVLCEVKVGAALSWCASNILRSAQTQIMLLDDRTAQAVADSKNEPITAAELQHLPHNPCLIEFHRPIEIAQKIKRGVRLRAVGFEAIGDAEAPAAVVCFYLDYWQAIGHGKRWPATIGIWFGGYIGLTMDRPVHTQIGIESNPAMDDAIVEECERVARNLWDFVTMRSINYERIKRQPAKNPLAAERPQRV